jgi:hypothetical protein
MKLLGAREFIKMSAGTFYIEYWRNTIEECFQIIDKFKKDPKSFLDIRADELHVFGDNSGSMLFSENKEENYIFYYDANVVGDACPSTTLYLVIDEKELPDEILIHDYENNIIKLSKDDIIRIKNIFINEVYGEYKDIWAFEELDKLSREGNKIVDVKIINY